MRFTLLVHHNMYTFTINYLALGRFSLGNQTLGKSERRIWEIGWGGSVHSGMLLALIICLLMLA